LKMTFPRQWILLLSYILCCPFHFITEQLLWNLLQSHQLLCIL
jgi:hypothetical protein